jgi:hypothetical protein
LGKEGELRDKEPKRFFITKEDLGEHGYTHGCPGCKAILKKTARQGHNEECRKKMEKALAGTDKVNKSKERVDGFVEKCLGKEDAKKRKTDEAEKERKEDVKDKGEKKGR